MYKNINEVFDHVVQSENEIKIRDKDVSAPFSSPVDCIRICWLFIRFGPREIGT